MNARKQVASLKKKLAQALSDLKNRTRQGVPLRKFKRNAARRHRLDGYEKSMRQIGRKNIVIPSSAKHIIKVQRGQKWIELARFHSEQLARDYGLAVKRRYPKVKVGYEGPNELKKNPAPRSPRSSPESAAAARRFQAFTGHKATRSKRVSVPTARAGLAIGPVLQVAYETTRDGKLEKYLHRFAPHARPLLAASHDGRSLFMLGGAYRFTERGIVDRKR